MRINIIRIRYLKIFYFYSVWIELPLKFIDLVTKYF